ncbi:MAG: CHAT domain-containing protein [Aequorivita sp.]
MEPIKKLIIYGEKEHTSNINEEVYNLQASNRDIAPKHEIDLEGKTIHLELSDGVTWMCDASTLHEVYPELDQKINKSAHRDGSAEAFVLPASIDAPPTERGIIGKIAVKVLKLVAKKAVSQGIGEIATRLEDAHLKNGIDEKDDVWAEADKLFKANKDNNIPTKTNLIKNGGGLFRVDEKFKFSIFDKTDKKSVNKPFFLFIHGTNSDTLGAFGDLQGTSAWTTLHQIYGNNILAFQHRTLTQSPLENVVKLADMLPDHARVHLLTHSRGGIVGDILNKYSTNGEGSKGFTQDHLALLEQENRQEDIDNIKALNRIFQEKTITVEKLIRVGCPAAGTKLASQRLDHILNVFFNLITLVGGAFADILKELLSAAIESKDDVNVLPGLEAQNPDSTFIKILNDPNPENAIEGQPLIVISGNGKFSVSLKGLVIILGKLFYWQRNDLVVNTDSMYLGAKRKDKIQYFFSQDGEVNHVNYFSHSKTREAIDLVLKTPANELIPGFAYIAQDEVPGTDRSMIEYGELYPTPWPPSGKRPIVVLLPGIMGSNLSQTGKEVWLHYGRILTGGLMNLDFSGVDKITAESIVKTSYYKLYKRLSGKYDVIVYPFDWRKPLNVCASEFELLVKALLKIEQPIKIIGHSMGGVLVRDFIVNHDDTWKRLRESKNFRLLFLGSPLGGSYRIPAVLFGEDAIIKKLSKLDLFHTKKTLLKMFSKFPGILSLLPFSTDGKDDFADMAVWEKMRTYFGDTSWPLPSLQDLEDFRKYRDNVLAKKDSIDYSKMVYIAGKDKITPCGYTLDEIKPKRKLGFLYTGEGDQSVTWKDGIPSQMEEANNVYYSNVTHGALANDPELFNAIDEILAFGRTKSLPTTRPAVRGEEKVFRTQPEVDFDLSEAGLEKTILGLGDDKSPQASQIPVTVTISNGDLRYASYPVLAGHFINDGVLFVEKAIDHNLKGSLSAKHRMGLYPGEIGTNAYFNKIKDNDFKGAIIIGLGEPDKLTSFQLAKSVEQGVLNYLLSIRGTAAASNNLGISAVIIASVYGGLSVEGSMKAILNGVNQANEKVKTIPGESYSTIQNIELVEVYANRALSCMYILNKIATKENSTFNIIIGNKRIKTLLGVRKRLPLDSTEDWWNRVAIKYKEGKTAEEPGSMVFGASTSDSREEENELHVSTPLIDLFISQVSKDNQWNSCTAKTLFELLIPNAFKETLKRQSNITWILDSKTASYPWELLQDNTTNAKPLCINGGMVRQLSTKDYRINIKRVAQKYALVVADPVLDGFVGQLPGAREEGALVKSTLGNYGYPVESIIGGDSGSIIKNLFCNDYSIIHLAGHGIFNPKFPQKSGMVIGNDIFLTVFEIKQMPVVPELVFINCCHLGYSDAGDEKLFQDRYKLAANIGTELISIGVKAVIAAGWVVDDVAAKHFAQVFYNSMFSGDSFGLAVQKARSYIYHNVPGNNTWGAYQCYGDPFFKLKFVAAEKSRWTPSYIVPQEAEIDLDNLLNELEVAIDENNNHLDSLNEIITAVDRDVFRTPQIKERIARIYQEMAMYGEAIASFKDLFEEEKAEFSFACMEKFCNIRAKQAIREAFQDHVLIPEERDKAYEKIEVVIEDLKVLLLAGKTTERLNLLGSAYKRLGMVSPNAKKRHEAYIRAMRFYELAQEHPRCDNQTYSFSNAVELACILKFNGIIKRNKYNFFGEDYDVLSNSAARKRLNDMKTELSKKMDDDNLEYWDMVASFNLDLCLLLVDEGKDIDEKWGEFSDSFKKIWRKAGSTGKKNAEMEHLHFLTYALNKTVSEKKADQNISFFGKRNTLEDLDESVDALRIAIGGVRKKIKLQKSKPASNKT